MITEVNRLVIFVWFHQLDWNLLISKLVFTTELPIKESAIGCQVQYWPILWIVLQSFAVIESWDSLILLDWDPKGLSRDPISLTVFLSDSHCIYLHWQLFYFWCSAEVLCKLNPQPDWLPRISVVLLVSKNGSLR